MRFMMMVKCSKEPEAGEPPNPALMAAIDKLTEEQMKAGIVLEVGGLLPSAMGARVRVAGGKVKVIDGPFAEAKELIGGYAILRAGSKQEAIERGTAFMQLHADILGSGFTGELEIRQMFDQPEASYG